MKFLQPPPITNDENELKNWRDSLYEWVQALSNGTSGLDFGNDYTSEGAITIRELDDSSKSSIAINTGVTIRTSGIGKLEVNTSEINHIYLKNSHNLTSDINHNLLNNYNRLEHFEAIDDETFSDNSNLKVPTQRSVRSYIEKYVAKKSLTYDYSGKNGYTGGLNFSKIGDIVFMTGTLGLMSAGSAPVCNTLSSDFIPLLIHKFLCVDDGGINNIITVNNSGNIHCNNSASSNSLTINGFWRV